MLEPVLADREKERFVMGAGRGAAILVGAVVVVVEEEAAAVPMMAAHRLAFASSDTARTFRPVGAGTGAGMR
jgi:hypothetical protein